MTISTVVSGTMKKSSCVSHSNANFISRRRQPKSELFVFVCVIVVIVVVYFFFFFSVAAAAAVGVVCSPESLTRLMCFSNRFIIKTDGFGYADSSAKNKSDKRQYQDG